MATSTGVKYIGKNDVYEDNILRTGLTWSKGETNILPEVMAKEFLKHPGMFAEVPGASYLIASPSGTGAAAGAGRVLTAGTGIEVGEAPATRDTSRKLIYRYGPDDLRVITRTPRGKLLQWTMRRNAFDSGSISVGGKSEFWRLLKLTELLNAYVFNPAESATSGTWTTGNTSMYPGSAGDRYQVTSYRSTVQGSSKTFAVTVPASGRVGVVVGVTASSPTLVTVACGAVSAQFDYREANDQAGTAKCRVLWLTGCTPGAGSVVVTLTTRESGQTLYLFGALIGDVGLGLPPSIPAGCGVVATFNLADELIGTASPGSSDIAINDEDLGKWVGSYHGGHASSAEMLDGGSALDVAATGAIAVATDPRIVQSGDLNGKAAIETEHRWSSPSELVLSGTIQGAINSRRAYIMMSTTRSDWTYIDGVETTATATSDVLPNSNTVWQQKPGDPSRTIYIRAHHALVNGLPVVPWPEKWVSGSTYAKTRLGVLDTVNVTAVTRIDFVAALGIAHA